MQLNYFARNNTRHGLHYRNEMVLVNIGYLAAISWTKTIFNSTEFSRNKDKHWTPIISNQIQNRNINFHINKPQQSSLDTHTHKKYLTVGYTKMAACKTNNAIIQFQNHRRSFYVLLFCVCFFFILSLSIETFSVIKNWATPTPRRVKIYMLFMV